jgi:DNA polymerase III delta' subunit
MLVEQKTQWNFLMRLTANNRLPQAIIFSGLPGLGKKEMALAWAQYLVCEKKAGQKSCGQCQQCQLVGKQRHPDIFLIEPTAKEIQVEQIREAQRQASLKPSLAKQQIFIVNEAQALNTEAQNCFLKTLEEPRGEALFVLIASQPDKLLETVRSRCSILKFYPQKPQPAAPENLKIVSEVLQGSLADRFLLAKKILADEADFNLRQFLSNFLAGLRHNLFLALEDSANQSKAFSARRLANIIERTEETRQLVTSTNVNSRLALENLMLNI